MIYGNLKYLKAWLWRKANHCRIQGLKVHYQEKLKRKQWFQLPVWFEYLPYSMWRWIDFMTSESQKAIRTQEVLWWGEGSSALILKWNNTTAEFQGAIQHGEGAAAVTAVTTSRLTFPPALAQSSAQHSYVGCMSPLKLMSHFRAMRRPCVALPWDLEAWWLGTAQ